MNKEYFLKTIEKHEMTIIKDDDLYRHLRFRQPESSNRYFDLITWKGHLCITGDMGTWVFARLDDMFNFFTGKDASLKEDLNINPSYWSEKIIGKSRFGGGTSQDGCTKFNFDLWKKNVIDHIKINWNLTDDEYSDCIKKLEKDVFDMCNEEYDSECYSSLLDFEYQDYTFDDEMPDGYKYIHHFLWICYAIVWGILKYKETKIIQEKNNSNELKPCPLCGAKVSYETAYYPYTPPSILGYHITCTCGLKYLKYSFGIESEKRLEDLFKDWNTRVQ